MSARDPEPLLHFWTAIGHGDAHEIRRFIFIERIAERVRIIFKLSDEDLLNPVNHSNRVKTRSVLTHWAVIEMGFPAAEVV
ncbi:MAG: hypothetical protein WA151_11420 [Desulfatirhabdiaceae bacterium]